VSQQGEAAPVQAVADAELRRDVREALDHNSA
jgi:hypothetical protein